MLVLAFALMLASAWEPSPGHTQIPIWPGTQPGAKVGPYRDCPVALADAQRALGLLRHQAARWHVDTRKIGVFGSSAGGHMVVSMSTHFRKRIYAAVDEADRESCRPDFAVALYPGHLAVREEGFVLNPDVHVTGDTPPTFLLHAHYAALRKAGVPAEMHVFVTGGHAFGARPTDAPITRWPPLVEAWLRTIRMIPD